MKRAISLCESFAGVGFGLNLIVKNMIKVLLENYRKLRGI